MLIKIQRSLKERQPIEMIYMNARLECTKRKVLVKRIEKDYITAYCLIRNDIRRFRIQDILAVSYPPSAHPTTKG
ncbi:hypothetical protein JI667_09615 [Bacillus sp. NTK074B]|uniref:WYL domain-containing protein n=1 Tax=Bacillus sp. NTK074B TaxID=2802174 RepID=UPI001A8EF110|nr:hypothetical protein [Bacillus sp. NTK074B]